MRLNRIRSAFFLLAVFIALQFADIFDTIPTTVESRQQTISIRSNDLPYALANSHNRTSTEVCCAYEKAFVTPNILELKRFFSIQVQISFDQIASSIIERPTSALYVLLLRILV